MAAIRRKSFIDSAKIVETESGEPYFDFCLKPGLINKSTDAQFYLGDLYPNKYSNTTDLRFPAKYADLSNFKLYQENIDEVLSKLYTAEAPFYGTPGSDFTAGLDTEKYAFNLFTGVSSFGVAYNSFKIDNSGSGVVRLSEGTNLFASGGSDGTMTDDTFNAAVIDAVTEYANPNSKLLNTAVHVESIIYDTGFNLEAKQALPSIIGIRKDTAVILVPHVSGGPTLSAAEEHSLAVMLRTRLQMFPESDYFGTPVVRGMIVGRTGVLRNSQYTQRLPIVIELAAKAARMMGAGNGKWKEEYLFDMAPNNQITMFDDVSEPFTPAVQRNKDWDVGLNYAMSYSRKALYFPALKTAYNDDTSVLNSFFVMMACLEIQKVGERAHRRFSGVTSLSDAQLIERVNAFVDENTMGRFANMFKVKPDAYMSNADTARGFSWTLPIRLYANSMKTVMSLSIEAYRMSDYAGK
jgi:hypothetical protein